MSEARFSKRLNQPCSRGYPPVSHETLLSEDDFDEVSERLTAGLATCRSMVENYTSLIRTEPMITAAEPEIAQDADAASISNPN